MRKLAEIREELRATHEMRAALLATGRRGIPLERTIRALERELEQSRRRA